MLPGSYLFRDAFSTETLILSTKLVLHHAKIPLTFPNFLKSSPKSSKRAI